MSLQKFDGEGWLGAHLLLTDSLPCELVRRLSQNVVGEAVQSLWNFYNRRLPDGGQWALAQSPDSLRDFSSMLATAHGMYAACCDLRDHELLSAEEKNAIGAAIAMAEALGVTRLRAPGHAASAGERLSDDPTTEAEEVADIPDGGCYELLSVADFRQGATYHRVRLRNLSRYGVMVEGPSDLLVDDRAAARISGQWLDGRIAWSLPGRSGLIFDRPFETPASLRDAATRGRPDVPCRDS